MKNVLKFMKENLKESILSPLFKMFEAIMELFVPIVMADIIDKGIGTGDTGYVVNRCLILAAIALAGFLFAVTAQYFAAKAAAGTTARLQSALFSHIMGFSYKKLDSIGASALLTRLTSDMDRIRNGINLTLRLFLRSPFIVFGALIMAFTIDKRAALIFLGVIPILFLVVFAIMLATIPMYKGVQKSLDGVVGAVRENILGARVIRAFCMEDREEEAFGKKTDELYRLQKHVGKISSLLNPVTYVIINLGIVLLIQTGAIRVYSGAMTRGAVVALYNYMTQILVELIKFADLIITMTRSVASARRVDEIMREKGGMTDGEEIFDDEGYPYSVEFEDAYLRYGDAEEPSVCGADIKIKKGETIGIIGGTGSGKTSFINMIPRFYDAAGGRVKVFGGDVRAWRIKELRKRIGIVPQNAVLFSGTVRDNMKWGKEDATDEEIKEALSFSGAMDFVLEKGGLDGMVSQGGVNFSGGQRQRLTIARALVRSPKILILDDSASALDYATEAALRKNIADIKNDKTVIIVSQRASSVKNADRIIVFDNGKICETGTHDELLKNGTVYREIYSSQFKEEEGSIE